MLLNDKSQVTQNISAWSYSWQYPFRQYLWSRFKLRHRSSETFPLQYVADLAESSHSEQKPAWCVSRDRPHLNWRYCPTGVGDFTLCILDAYAKTCYFCMDKESHPHISVGMIAYACARACTVYEYWQMVWFHGVCGVFQRNGLKAKFLFKFFKTSIIGLVLEYMPCN